jgi:hypothetical protein
MIRVDIDEQFPVSVQLLNERTNRLVKYRTVGYEVLDVDDNPLIPPVSGTMTESTSTRGIYNTEISLSSAGRYIFYATCSGFSENAEEILVNPENIYELTKQNRHYNIGVEEVLRTNAIATASQTTRNVALNKTDYVINRIKMDSDSYWNGTTVSGNIYAWYRNLGDDIPYKMGGPN